MFSNSVDPEQAVLPSTFVHELVLSKIKYLNVLVNIRSEFQGGNLNMYNIRSTINNTYYQIKNM